MRSGKLKVTISREDLVFKPRHTLKASKRHKTSKDYTRKVKHKKRERD